MYIEIQVTKAQLEDLLYNPLVENFPKCFSADFVVPPDALPNKAPLINKDTKYLPDHIEFPNKPVINNIYDDNRFSITIDMHYYVAKVLRDSKSSITGLEVISDQIIVPIMFDITVHLEKFFNNLLYTVKFTGIEGNENAQQAILSKFSDYHLGQLPLFVMLCIKNPQFDSRCSTLFAEKKSRIDISQLLSLGFNPAVVMLAKHHTADCIAVRLSDSVTEESFRQGDYIVRIPEEQGWALFVGKEAVIPLMQAELQAEIEQASIKSGQSFNILESVTVLWRSSSLFSFTNASAISAKFMGSATVECITDVDIEFDAKITVYVYVESANILALKVYTRIAPDPGAFDAIQCAISKVLGWIGNIFIAPFGRLFSDGGGGILGILSQLLGDMSDEKSPECDKGFVVQEIEKGPERIVSIYRMKVCLDVKNMGDFTLLSASKTDDGLTFSGRYDSLPFKFLRAGVRITDRSSDFFITGCFNQVERGGILIQTYADAWVHLCAFVELNKKDPESDDDYFFTLVQNGKNIGVGMPLHLPEAYKQNPYPLELFILTALGAFFIKIAPVTVEPKEEQLEQIIRQNETTCLARLINIYRGFKYIIPLPRPEPDPGPLQEIGLWIISVITTGARIRSEFSLCIGEQCMANSRVFAGGKAVLNAVIPAGSNTKEITLLRKLPLACRLFERIFESKRVEGSVRVTFEGVTKIARLQKPYHTILRASRDSENVLVGLSATSIDYLSVSSESIVLVDQLHLAGVKKVLRIGNGEIVVTDECGVLYLNEATASTARILQLQRHHLVEMYADYLYVFEGQSLSVYQLPRFGNQKCATNVEYDAFHPRKIQSIKVKAASVMLAHSGRLYIGDENKVMRYDIRETGLLRRRTTSYIRHVSKIFPAAPSHSVKGVVIQSKSKSYLFPHTDQFCKPMVVYDQLPWNHDIITLNNGMIKLENAIVTLYRVTDTHVVVGATNPGVYKD